MAAAGDVLDAAFDRLGQWGFDDPDGYVNHGPMACEALDALGRPGGGRLVVAARHRDSAGHPGRAATGSCGRTRSATPHGPASGWATSSVAVADDGWAPVLERVAAAAAPRDGRRAVPRRDPLRPRSPRHRDGRHAGPARPSSSAPSGTGPRCGPRALRPTSRRSAAWTTSSSTWCAAAADAARRYLARPNIIHLHGVTAAMAVSILIRHVDEATAATALAQVEAEHAALYERTEPVRPRRRARHRRSNVGRRGDRQRRRPRGQARRGVPSRVRRDRRPGVPRGGRARHPPRPPHAHLVTAPGRRGISTRQPRRRRLHGPRSATDPVASPGTTTPEEDSDGDGADGVDRSGPVHGRRDL